MAVVQVRRRGRVCKLNGPVRRPRRNIYRDARALDCKKSFIRVDSMWPEISLVRTFRALLDTVLLVFKDGHGMRLIYCVRVALNDSNRCRGDLGMEFACDVAVRAA